jgi:hypothetical protein
LLASIESLPSNSERHIFLSISNWNEHVLRISINCRVQEGIHHFQILSGYGKKILAESSGEI